MINQNLNRNIGPGAVSAKIHVPAANTACVITIAADPVRKHVCHLVQWSYSTAPTGGRLTIEDGAGTVVFDVDITAAGPGGLTLFISGSANKAMVITLAAGGAAVQGKLNAQVVSTGAD